MFELREDLSLVAAALQVTVCTCCWMLNILARDVKLRAEAGEALASRYSVLPLYERLYIDIGVAYFIGAALLCAGNFFTITSARVNWSEENTNFCGIMCASFIPLRSLFSIWCTHSSAKVLPCLVVWFSVGAALITLPPIENMSRNIEIWCRIVACVPSLLVGFIGIFQSRQDTYSRPCCRYSCFLLAAYALASLFYQVVVWTTRLPDSPVIVIVIYAGCTSMVPVALVCDARLDTARWKRFGKTSSRAIYDTCFSPTLPLWPHTSPQTGSSGPGTNVSSQGKEGSGRDALYMALSGGCGVRSPFGAQVMYNVNKYLLDFSGVAPSWQFHTHHLMNGHAYREGITVRPGLYRSERVAITTLSGSRAEAAASAEGVRALKVEMLLYHSLWDPSVLQVIGVCFAPPVVTVLSELCERGSLHTSLRRDRSEWGDKARRLLACANACRAVSRAHSHGIPHGDISAHYFMVTSLWSLKLTGFEVSRNAGRDSRSVMQLPIDISVKPHIATTCAPSPFCGEKQRECEASLQRDVEALGWLIVEIWTRGDISLNSLDRETCILHPGVSGDVIRREAVVEWICSCSSQKPSFRESSLGRYCREQLGDLPSCLLAVLKACLGDSPNKTRGAHALLSGLLAPLARLAARTAGELSPTPPPAPHTHSPSMRIALQYSPRSVDQRRRKDPFQEGTAATIALDDFCDDSNDVAETSCGGCMRGSGCSTQSISPQSYRKGSVRMSGFDSAPKKDDYFPVSTHCIHTDSELNGSSSSMNPMIANQE